MINLRKNNKSIIIVLLMLLEICVIFFAYKSYSNRNNTLDEGVTRQASLRLYSFKIFEGNDLKRYYVPVVRNLDSVAGLYDLVNDKFYANAGSGAFTVPN